MKIIDYYFDETGASPDELNTQDAVIIPAGSLDSASFLTLPKSALAFEGRRGWPMFALFKQSGGLVEAASPFGRHVFNFPLLEKNDEVGLVSVRKPFGAFSWTVSLTPQWANDSGEPCDPSYFKAKRLGSNLWEPLHQVRFMRSASGSVREWCVIFLPAPAVSIITLNGAAQIISDNKTFLLPKGKASELALSGKAQWATPDATGVFVLADEPK